MNKFYLILLLSFCFVTVSAQSPVANFTASDTMTCWGNCITFTNLSQNASSYKWYFPGGYPSSDTATDSILVCYLFNEGSYDVTLVSSDGVNSDTLTLKNYITILPTPPTPSITGSPCIDSLYCTTDTSYISYQWYEDTTLIPGATTPVLHEHNLSHNYSVKVANRYGCSIATGFFYFEPPAYVCDISCSKNIICQGECIDFSASIYFQSGQHWSFPGANPPDSYDHNPTNICYDHTGIYDVSASAWNPINGGYGLSKLGFITVLPAPPAPLITQHNDTLFCSPDSSYSSFQWYFNNTIINGATNAFLPISQNGKYDIRVSNQAGCQAAADTTILLGIIDPVNYPFISLSPNPAGNLITIECSHTISAEPATVKIMNVLGEIAKETIINSGNKLNVDISNLHQGIYFINVSFGSGKWTGKFVKD